MRRRREGALASTGNSVETASHDCVHEPGDTGQIEEWHNPDPAANGRKELLATGYLTNRVSIPRCDMGAENSLSSVIKCLGS